MSGSRGKNNHNRDENAKTGSASAVRSAIGYLQAITPSVSSAIGYLQAITLAVSFAISCQQAIAPESV